MGEEEKEKRERRVIEESVELLSEAAKRAPELKGVPTGVDGLDELFFTTKIVRKKPKKIPLGGYPSYAVINLTGVPDTGKSLMVEQFAVKQASMGHKVGFITVESPAAFVSTALKSRATAMGIDEKDIDENIVLIDAASYTALRDDIPTLLDTLAYAIKTYKIKFTIIDSVTGLYEAKEMLARSIVRRLFNFMKKWYQTALFVSQKRSGHEELSAEAAGGYAVSHIVDCTLVLSKKMIASRYDENLFGKPIGELVRLFRIDGCRLCGHDTDTHYLEITETGLVKIGPSLKDIRAKSYAK
ncbi:MAG: KaiC domain-containing protein [Candidatus Hydrothermota bacterium]|nr:MAG: KaiC domain-containing protein [Candidatus Hydrothermae bacterium]